MNENLLKRFPDIVLRYFNDTGAMISLVLDRELVIEDCNPFFVKLLGWDSAPVGENILAVLAKDSHGIFSPPPEAEVFKRKIVFVSKDDLAMPMDCQIFRLGEEGHRLILGGHLVMTNADIVAKMTELSNELANMTRELRRKNRDLSEANEKIKILSGVIPICMHCKKIRDDAGYWNRLEKFITEHSEAKFSHGVCPECRENFYSDIFVDAKADGGVKT